MKYGAILAALFAVTLGGCASLQNAGVASYAIKPMMIDKQQVCCEVTLLNGKQYAQLNVDIVKDGDKYTVHLTESGVEAFQGQAIAAGATKDAVVEAAKIGVAAALAPVMPLLLPSAGAMLASPGIGAAALGAGAVLGGQKLLAPSDPTKP